MKVININKDKGNLREGFAASREKSSKIFESYKDKDMAYLNIEVYLRDKHSDIVNTNFAFDNSQAHKHLCFYLERVLDDLRNLARPQKVEK